MKVILYGRVSTAEQSCEGQMMELRRICADRKWIVLHEIVDVISGTKRDREGLDRLLGLVRAGGIDAVLAVKIDRIARSLRHFAQITAELLKRDVALVCPGQGIDTSSSNPCARFQVNILASVAEFERDLISERTKSGLVVARAAGKILGKPSKKMATINRGAIVAAWREKQGGTYEELGLALGGVSAATAWRVAKAHGALRPKETEVMDAD